MSRFVPEEVSCPCCGDRRERSVYRSVNAERSPRLRAAIVADEFQRVECPACGLSFAIGSPFIYVDGARREWFAVYSRADRASWRALEDASELAFQAAAGPRAPAAVRPLFAGCVRRTVFGLEALREKIVCRAAGLDDVALELFKLRAAGLIVGGAVLGLDVELRLVEVDADQAVLECGGEEVACELLAVDRAELDAFVAAVAPDDPMYVRLAAGPFVDLARLTHPGDRPAALLLDGRPIY